jgi:hypothetical protein
LGCGSGVLGLLALRAMTTLILRRQRAQEQLEGRHHIHDWKDTDYAVVEGMCRVGRIYQEPAPGGLRWLWLLDLMGAWPSRGSADTLDDAMAQFKHAYEQNRTK